MRKSIVGFVVAGLVSAAVVTAAPEARAQTTADPGRIDAFPQGMIGTGLLGAEAVIMIEGAVGVRNKWILLGSGAAGLVAGGVGGYFIDRAIDDSATNSSLSVISTGLLAVGLGLVIPTAIVYANATMYRPDETNSSTDNAPAAPLEESTGGAQPGAAPAPSSSKRTAARRARALRPLPDALFNYEPGRLTLWLPAVSSVRSYSLDEMRRYGLAPQSEWRVPLVTARF